MKCIRQCIEIIIGRCVGCMKKLSLNWNVRQLKKMYENKIISFEHPIQRSGDQWDISQKSLLIHSILEDFPVPALYSKAEEATIDGEVKNVYYILDGKQRLTSIISYLNNEYALHKDTPNAHVYGKEYNIANKKFDDLEEGLRDEIISFSLQIYRLDEATDEDIEEVFFRLNNGTSLSKQQKARSKMGLEWVAKIKELIDNPLMNKASFTGLQIRKAENETAILQAIMMIDQTYEWKSISSNEIFDYSQTFKDDESKDKYIQRVKSSMDYLNESLSEDNDVMLKKTNFPMTVITAMVAMDNNISTESFNYWTMEFRKELFRGKGSVIPTDYKNYTGTGSVRKYKAIGRTREMVKHLLTYFDIEDKSVLNKLDNMSA